MILMFSDFWDCRGHPPVNSPRLGPFFSGEFSVEPLRPRLPSSRVQLLIYWMLTHIINCSWFFRQLLVINPTYIKQFWTDLLLVFACLCSLHDQFLTPHHPGCPGLTGDFVLRDLPGHDSKHLGAAPWPRVVHHLKMMVNQRWHAMSISWWWWKEGSPRGPEDEILCHTKLHEQYLMGELGQYCTSMLLLDAIGISEI